MIGRTSALCYLGELVRTGDADGLTLPRATSCRKQLSKVSDRLPVASALPGDVRDWMWDLLHAKQYYWPMPSPSCKRKVML